MVFRNHIFFLSNTMIVRPGILKSWNSNINQGAGKNKIWIY